MAKGEKRAKHVPERSCVVCRQKKPKRELTRIVRTPEGAVQIDPKGRQAGRGAYLCRSKACWESGLKGGRISRALRTEIGASDRAQLVAYGESLMLEGTGSGDATQGLN